MNWWGELVPLALRVETVRDALQQANQALDGLRAGRVSGTAVLVP